MRKKAIMRTLSLFLALAMQFSLMAVPVYGAEAPQTSPVELAAAANSEHDAILANCGVTFMKDGKERTEPFRENETSVDVKVKLDTSIASCYMTIYAYASNTAFDPDDSHNTVLWSGSVTNGLEQNCQFKTTALPLKVGYSVAASLNVLVDPATDWYKQVKSKPLQIVDENGQGFQDYIYPNAQIVENSLKSGATKLHISLTGDKRIFQAAKAKKTSVNVAVAQYPADASFDFESTEQTTLYSAFSVKDPINNLEVSLSEPLKDGYRVRAIVYWEQNQELFLPKGNDYEAIFGMPDDSVVVGQEPAKPAGDFSVALNGTLTEESTGASFHITAKEAVSTINIVKLCKIGADGRPDTAAPVAQKYGQNPGEISFDLPNSTLHTGDQVCLHLTYNNAASTYVSQTFVVSAPADVKPTAAISEVTTDSKTITVTLTGEIPAGSMILLKRFRAGETSFASNQGEWVASAFDVTAGSNRLSPKVNSLVKGEKLVAFVLKDGTPVAQSAPTVITATADMKPTAVISEVTTDSKTITVTLTGKIPAKARLIVKRFAADVSSFASNDGVFVAAEDAKNGVVTLTPNAASLVKDEKLVAFVLHAGELVTQSAPVVITVPGSETANASVSIVTQDISADRTDLWVKADFTPGLTGTLTLYTFTGDTFSKDTAVNIYSEAIQPDGNSQRISFDAGKLTAGHRLIAVLMLSDHTEVQSQVRTIQAVPVKDQAAVAITDQTITEGDNKINATVTLDRSVGSAQYALYQFTGETLDTSTAQKLSTGTVYRSNPRLSIVVGQKLILHAKLQVVLTVEGEEYFSNVVTVEPAPDWGHPSAVLDTAFVSADAKTIPVYVQYSEEYLTLGKEFYCDVTLYQFSGEYTDDEFIGNEMWETRATRIGQINSVLGHTTLGHVEVPVLDTVTLQPGDRIIAKLRLPHKEWEGEEEDFLSFSVPVLKPGEKLPDVRIVLYNLGEESSRGYRLRNILNELKFPYVTVTDRDLNETVGYLAGLDGFESMNDPYTGPAHTAEFMLMCNLSENQLDRFLAAMSETGLKINHKAIVTKYNQDTPLIDLIERIEEEHNVLNGQIQLDKLIKIVEKLPQNQYGTHPDWEALQKAVAEGNALLGTFEPAPEDLQAAYDKIKGLYLSTTNQSDLTGKAVLTIQQEQGGTYAVTANVEGGEPGRTYDYQWSNGKTGQTITGIPANKLTGAVVTITADNCFGQLTAQLEVPAVPQISVREQANSVTVSWTVPQAVDNRPAPTAYSVSVYLDGKLVKEVNCNGSESSANITDLTSNTQYTVQVAALSPVGRSDLAVLDAKTCKPESGHSGGGSSRPHEPNKPQPQKPVESFGDVQPDDWCFNEVEFVLKKGLMQGTSDKLFEPQKTTNRAMVITILYRLEGSPAVDTVVNFKDISTDSYYYSALCWAVENGLVAGYDEDSFAPWQPVSRQQLATFLWRYAKHHNDKDTGGSLNGFVDGDSVAPYAREAIAWTVENGVMQGSQDNRLAPYATATRAHLAVMLYRLCNLK